MQTPQTGYLNEKYAQSLAEFGMPRLLPNSRGWILQRSIADTPYSDAMGCYPLFTCEDWQQLEKDLKNIDDLVSLALVTSPFDDYDESLLKHIFHHVVAPYKQHYVVDLSEPLEEHLSTHHKRNIRKAEQQVQVLIEPAPLTWLDEWGSLYNHLIGRHQITGIAAFSDASFRIQFDVPGLAMFRAVHNDETIGIMIWYMQNSVAYYHLAAYNDLGYTLRASYALIYSAVKYYQSQNLNWISLGAGAGVTNDSNDGLNRFKRGWSTGTRPVYFCGYIFDSELYERLTIAKNMSPMETFFPKYRA